MNRIEPPPPQHRRLTRTSADVLSRPERVFTGIAVSAGVAIGQVFRASEPDIPVVRQKIHAADVAAEGARLEAAVAQSRKQLAKLRARLSVLPENSQNEIAPLIDAYTHMLASNRLLDRIRRRISDTLLSAESAVMAEARALAAVMAAQGDSGADDIANPQRRADEVLEIARRLVRNLTHAPFRSFTGLPEGAILFSESLSPADAALLDPSRLAGVATEEGGADGHTAVMLRALGVPSVLGVTGLARALTANQSAVIDGIAGTVVLDPSPARIASARRAVTAFARERQRFSLLRRLPAETRDGTAVELQANLELPVELPLIVQSGAVGIGLFRTEFLFMNRETVPDEDSQTEQYRAIVDAMHGDPVSFRVLDWGGEKEIEALAWAGMVPDVMAPNPALGVRGIRLLLRTPELFEPQLAAILRASAAGPVRVLLPMVTTVGEVRAARAIYERVASQLRQRGERLPEQLPPLGIMIETPGAALSADALALEADFFAIGTNDLTAYTLAVDRGDSEVAALYDPLHPAVPRLIQFTAAAANRVGKPVSICGEIAGNPRFTPLLLGLGIRSFSMSASGVPRVKQAVRAVDIESCARLAEEVMVQHDPSRIAALVDRFQARA